MALEDDVTRRVLFLCTGNSARSQIAEGLLRHLGGDRFEVHSAGTRPRPGVHPLAIRVMASYGVDIRTQRPKSVDELEGMRFDDVITVCDGAKESCPVMPGARMIHWSFEDPAAAPEGQQLQAFEAVLRGLERRIELFIAAR